MPSSILLPERLRTSRRVTWLTVVGIVLIPALVGGLLVWGLWRPTAHLDRVSAAVVNNDQAVTVDGRTVPLGRQLTALLVTGTDGSGAAVPATEASNFDWAITDDADAAAGLASGRYAAVVTIPTNFSAAATSFSDASTAQQATLEVSTSDRARALDPILARAVTHSAASVLGATLTRTYLQNVYIGFGTLHERLGQAGNGAAELDAGADELSGGAASVKSAATSLADGTAGIASGATSLDRGAGTLEQGSSQLASGASDLADGLATLAAATRKSAAAASAAVPGTQQFAAGLESLAAGVGGSATTPGLSQGSSALAAGTAGLAAGLQGLGQAVDQLLPACSAGVATACAQLQVLLGTDTAPTPPSSGQPPSLAYLTAVAGQVSVGAADLDASVNTGSASTPALTTSTRELAKSGRALAAGAEQSAQGLATLSGHLSDSAGGAAALADGAASAAQGAARLADGSRRLSAGAASASDGAARLADGAGSLATGAGSLSSGASQLSTGLAQAVDSVPSYSTEQGERLAEIVASPVVADAASATDGSALTVPYVVALALWLGGLATFLVLPAVSPRALGSTRSSVRLTLRTLAPAAIVGALQAVLLTAVLSGVLGVGVGGWFAFAGLAVVAGVVSAAANQGLAAAFGGVGRWLAAAVAALALASAFVSTGPAVLGSLFALTPLAAAVTGLASVLSGVAAGGAVLLLVLWGLLGLGLALAATARQRVVPAGRLARWRPAGARGETSPVSVN